MKYNLEKYLLISCCLLFNADVLAAENTSAVQLSDQQRLQRLETLMSSDVLRGQAETIRSLHEEIASLREHIEQQEYELDSLKQRQRNLYLDMDRRLSNVEAGSRNTGSTALPVPPPNSGLTSSVPPSDATVGGGADGQEAYSKAFALLKEGQYEQSITAFEAFKQRYPNSKYADNAQYWLGEANYVSRDYKQALTEFQRLIAQYPDSTKNAGAHLKIGYVYFELKNWTAASEALEKVIKLYPDSSVAKKAKERLQRMKREGH